MSLDTDRTAPIEERGAVEERRVLVEGDSVVTTPTLRRLARRASFWVGLAAVLVVFALVVIAISGTGSAGPDLSGTNASGNGSKALIQVLRSDGVTVDTPRTLRSAVRDVASGGTLAVYDPHDLLTRDQLAQLDGAADTLVLIQPSFTMLDTLAPQVRLAGSGLTQFAADDSDACGFGPARRADGVTSTSQAYRVSSSATGGFQTCFPDGDGAYSLITSTDDATVDVPSVVVFGLADTLTNDQISKSGNGALALGTFGAHDHLTWYLPSQADVTPSAADRPVALPPWVLPTELLAALVVLAAAIWRGRRFGPLVIERLPVVVRSSETMDGRARLYQRGSSRAHALDAIRIGTIGRLAELCGLPAVASVDEIIGAVSVVSGIDAAELRSLLVDEVPRSDARMLDLTTRLDDLEATVTRATRPV